MKNKLVRLLTMLLVASSIFTACGGEENNGTLQGIDNTANVDTDSYNNQQTDMPQFIEFSEKERAAFEIMAQYITSTRWGEELWGDTITPTEETICSFISRMASENHFFKMGEYDSFLPDSTVDEIYGITYLCMEL